MNRHPLTPPRPRLAFVTGATGFVGSFLVDRLLRDGVQVVALARGRHAIERVHAAVTRAAGAGQSDDGFWPGLRVVSGDVCEPMLGLPPAEAAALAEGIDEVWHCAASFGSSSAGDEPHRVNVHGTENVLRLAEAGNRRRTVCFYHVSTAFAADRRDGWARETAPIEEGTGQNDYERSKRRAERLVLEWQQRSGFPAVIFRPAVIVGHSRSGRASGFAAYYDVMRSLAAIARIQGERDAAAFRGDLNLRILSQPGLRLNVVTIDFVIDAMCALARVPRGAQNTFHVVNEAPALVEDLIAGICRSLGLTGVDLVTEADFATRPMTRIERLFHSMISFERPYFQNEVSFDSTEFRRLVPIGTLPSPAIDAPLLRRINRVYLDECERQAAGHRELKLRSAALPTAAG